MFRLVLSWLISLRDSVVAEQRAVIASRNECNATLARQRDEALASLDRHKESLDRTIRTLDAVLDAVGVSDQDDWSPAAAAHAVGAQLDRLRAADIRRAESAESAAEDLRRELRDLQRQLETEQRAHEATRHEKKCTEAENRLLAKIHEVDVQRRQAELSGLVQKQVEAEAGVAALKADE